MSEPKTKKWFEDPKRVLELYPPEVSCKSMEIKPIEQRQPRVSFDITIRYSQMTIEHATEAVCQQILKIPTHGSGLEGPIQGPLREAIEQEYLFRMA